MQCIVLGQNEISDLQTHISKLLACQLKEKNSFISLTKREKDVLDLVRQGYTQKKISSVLGISNSTVESHKSRLFKKFEVRSSIELVTKISSS